MSSDRDGSAFVRWYRSRIGEPTNNDEVYGYWVFVVGVVLAVVGLLWYVLAGGGVVLVFGGSVYRLPLGRLATWLTSLGGLLGLAAVAWFVTVFPSGWRIGGSTATQVILLYLAGLAVIAAGAVIGPIIPGRREREVKERGREIDRLRDQLEAREATVEDLRSQLEEADRASADREAGAREDREELEWTLSAVRDEREALERELEAAREAEAASGERATVAELRLAEIQNSHGTFEFYEDTAGEWRWRLVHRNGNTLADSGEGYTERREAENAIESIDSVKRNLPHAPEHEAEGDDGAVTGEQGPVTVTEPRPFMC